jgi:hypothetical protein
MIHRLSARLVGDRRGMVGLVVLMGALAGLFTMHGLSGHGTAHYEFSTAPMDSVMVAIDRQSFDGSVTSADVGSGAPSVDRQGDNSSHLGMAGLCLAVLAGALLVGLRLRPSRAGRFAGRRGRTDPSGLLPAALRDRDPPCLFWLTIQLC